MKWLGVLGIVGLASLSCGDSEQATPACTPGESVACTGPQACSGFQVCASDGASFGACDCSGGVTTAATTTSSGTTGQGGDMTSSSSSVGGEGTGGSGGSGTGGAPPFSPTDLPGLSLWLHADAGLIFDPQDPGTVLKWEDQSPHGHQANASAQQGWEPIIDPSAINGYDAVRCFGNGALFTIVDDPSLQFGTGGFLLAGIVRPGVGFTPGNPIIFFAKQGVTTNLDFTQPTQDTLRLLIGADSVTTSFTPNNTYRLVIARGPALSLRIDGSLSTGPTTTANVDNVGSSVLFCGGGSTDIAISEFIAVKGDPGDVATEQVRQYFIDKYDL